MQALLGWFEAAATRRPATVIAVLAAVTVGLAALASTNELEVDLTRLGSEGSETVAAMERVRDEFGDPAAAVQVVLDAGPDGDMLTVAGLAAMREARETVLDALGPDVRTDGEGQAQLLSIGAAVDGVLDASAADPATVDDAHVGAAAAQVMAANPQLAALASDDVDLSAGRARATVVVALLDPDLTEAERTEIGERVREAFGPDPRVGEADARVTVFSSDLFVAGLLDAVRAEAPPLFGLALLVVLAILALAYRSVHDVAVGLVGLLSVVIWTFGFVALLGPGHLGWTGPPSQLAVVVPVLLVGLGIDYSVHLTSRYREQRVAGQDPAAAGGRALRTVGSALVLATAATATGFAATATAPLQMIADFGVFVAVGVVCAFTVMALLVPAARVLRDRRRGAAEAGAVRQLPLARFMRAPAALALRRPAAGLLAAAVLAAASLWAATGLATEFDRADFVPEGSEVEAVLSHQDELFGSGLTESTFAVIDGDLTDPGVANAMRDAQKELAGVGGVRTVGGVPQVRSVISMAAAALGDDAAALGDDAAAPGDPPVIREDGGFAPDADLAAVYDMLRQSVGDEAVAQVLSADARSGLVQIRTTVGDAGAERLQREVRAAFRPVERAGARVTVTSDPLIIAEMSDDLGRFQARAVGSTLAVVLALLAGYYALAHRRWMLGVVAMIPAILSASLVLATMRLADLSFNAVTATMTAIAVGIGVPYGVHVVNRFVEDLAGASVAEAVPATLRGSGAALTGSALTTLGAFVVLSFSDLLPIRSLGLLGGAGIAFALLASILVEPGALVLWARRRARRADPGTGPAQPAHARPPRSRV